MSNEQSQQYFDIFTNCITPAQESFVVRVIQGVRSIQVPQVDDIDECEFGEILIVPEPNLEIHPVMFYWHFAGGWTFEIPRDALPTPIDIHEVDRWPIIREECVMRSMYYNRYFYREGLTNASPAESTSKMRAEVAALMHVLVENQVGEEYYPVYFEHEAE